ncbi:hypothetical protein EVG20_g8957 [Dentipellis fragilis]|uniref:Uncharacterized protein n=1 Tax=Dentipellis fragilis TaxID=205917 RepID=A0A4Y9Y6A3_9AGAM|nr:hypothetical protein EVG20_g8957 [Dentipellis fragilis]
MQRFPYPTTVHSTAEPSGPSSDVASSLLLRAGASSSFALSDNVAPDRTSSSMTAPLLQSGNPSPSSMPSRNSTPISQSFPSMSPTTHGSETAPCGHTSESNSTSSMSTVHASPSPTQNVIVQSPTSRRFGTRKIKVAPRGKFKSPSPSKAQRSIVRAKGQIRRKKIASKAQPEAEGEELEPEDSADAVRARRRRVQRRTLITQMRDEIEEFLGGISVKDLTENEVLQAGVEFIQSSKKFTLEREGRFRDFEAMAANFKMRMESLESENVIAIEQAVASERSGLEAIKRQWESGLAELESLMEQAKHNKVRLQQQLEQLEHNEKLYERYRAAADLYLELQAQLDSTQAELKKL